MIALVRAGLSDGWSRLMHAVEEALRSGRHATAAAVHAHSADAGSRKSGSDMRSRYRRNWRSSNARNR